MKIGIFSDGLGRKPFLQMLDWCAANGIPGIEVGTGNFSSGVHVDLDGLIASSQARADFLEAFACRGLELTALNCSGNILDGSRERRQKHQDVFFKSIKLASLLGLKTIVAMSGCPGEAGDAASYPNWVTSYWQAEYQHLLAWQWKEAVEPFWHDAARVLSDAGVRVAIEMHPGQSVYNPFTLRQLMNITGPVVGANLDPSHLFWQGIEPLRVIEALGPAIYHVHIKDCWIDADETALNGVIDNRLTAGRSWGHCSPGVGHGEYYWFQFVAALKKQGYAGPLSIEYAGASDRVEEGLRESVALLNRSLAYAAGQVSAE